MAFTPEIDVRKNPKNYLINGDMRIAQRGTSFASPADNTYTLDRFKYNKLSTATHTVSQDVDIPTLAESGYLFVNSMRLALTLADTSIAAGDAVFMTQVMEGYNWANLAQKPFTLSFWVKATLTGTYCVAFRNSGLDRSYVSEYTINTSNTWEYKTITVSASPAAGTWNYTTGAGLNINFILAAGTNFQSTANSWLSANALATSNQVNGVNTGSSDFKITGVMINEGAQALPFRLFGGDVSGEVASCQRYYEKSYNVDVNPGTQTDAGRCAMILSSVAALNNNSWFGHRFVVSKRANPTVTLYATAVANQPGRFTDSGGVTRIGTGTETGMAGFSWKHSDPSSTSGFVFHFTAEAEL